METQKEVIEYMVCEEDVQTGRWFARKECDKLEQAEKWLKSYAKEHPHLSWGIVKKTVKYDTFKIEKKKTPAEELFQLLEQHATLPNDKGLDYPAIVKFLQSVIAGTQSNSVMESVINANLTYLRNALGQNEQVEESFTYKLNPETCRYEKSKI